MDAPSDSPTTNQRLYQCSQPPASKKITQQQKNGKAYRGALDCQYETVRCSATIDCRKLTAMGHQQTHLGTLAASLAAIYSGGAAYPFERDAHESHVVVSIGFLAQNRGVSHLTFNLCWRFWFERVVDRSRRSCRWRIQSVRCRVVPNDDHGSPRRHRCFDSKRLYAIKFERHG